MTLVESHGLANRPGEPYPATFRMFQWTHWESNPDLRPAEPVSSRWTMSPLVEWTGRESNPSHRLCKSQSPPWNMPAHKEVRPGIEPGPRPYHGRVRPKHLQTIE